VELGSIRSCIHLFEERKTVANLNYSNSKFSLPLGALLSKGLEIRFLLGRYVLHHGWQVPEVVGNTFAQTLRPV
jgi:hypothetical protein